MFPCAPSVVLAAQVLLLRLAALGTINHHFRESICLHLHCLTSAAPLRLHFKFPNTHKSSMHCSLWCRGYWASSCFVTAWPGWGG